MKYALTLALSTAFIFGGCSGGGSAVDLYVDAEILIEEGDSDQALVLLYKAVNADPELASAHAAIGRIYADRADYDKAAGAFSRSLAVNGYNDQVREELAASYEKLGQADKAAEVRGR